MHASFVRRPRLVTLLVTMAVLWGFPAARGQLSCQVVSTLATAAPATVSKVVLVVVPSDNAGLCSTVSSGNAGCNAPGGWSGGPFTLTRTFKAYNPAANPNPFCQFRCQHGATSGNCQIRIDSDDGLPVELMDFGVESGGHPEPGPDEGDDPGA